MWDELDAAPVKSPPVRRRLKLKPHEAVVIVMIVAVLVALLLPSPDYDRTHRYPPPDPGGRLSFGAVAGEYTQGAQRGRSWTLSILPDGRYSFLWSGCCGVYYRERGFVIRADETLALSAIEPIEPRIPRVFVPVKWERRTYLVPPRRLQEFCDEIINGKEPRSAQPGHFYVLGLENRVAGVPELPEQWVRYLRKNLVVSARETQIPPLLWPLIERSGR